MSTSFNSETPGMLATSPSYYSKKRTRKADAVHRHFSELYEPNQLQEMNDLLEIGWSCAICLDTADDPCVTRCGHMYCREHISECLAKSQFCPVCHTPCTPAHDIIPVFTRDDDDFSPFESLADAESPATPITREPDSQPFSPEFPHVSYEKNEDRGYFSLRFRPWPVSSISLPSSTSPSENEGSESYHQQQLEQLRGTSTQGFITYILTHYLGITLRVLGLALLLGYLLPRTLFKRIGDIGGDLEI